MINYDDNNDHAMVMEVKLITLPLQLTALMNNNNDVAD